MTLRGNTALEEANDDSQIDEGRRTACLALGIDPATVAWPRASEALKQSDSEPPEPMRLSDEEWDVLAPILPAQAPQASSMSNRDFLNAVLAAMRRGGVWTSRHTPTGDIEAVRRRFGRWARLRVFQAVADALHALALSPECKRLLAFAGERAGQLRARAAR